MKATPKAVWELWTDVENWPTWDDEVEWSQLDGPFQAGTTGQLKPKGGPAIAFTLTDVKSGKAFSNLSQIPMTTILFEHTLTPTDNFQLLIKHHVTVSGLLAPLLYFTMRKNLQKGLPIALLKLGKKAEEASRD